MDVDDCFLKGSKSRIISQVVNHFGTLAMMNRIIGTVEAIEIAINCEKQRDEFLTKIGIVPENYLCQNI